MFRGVYTAMVTPFDKEGAVDFQTLRALVDGQINGGVDGLVPTGTTGESPTLSAAEHLEVIRCVIDQAADRVPVIAGTGSNSTQEAIDYTLEAKTAGASASLQVAPYYNKPTQEGFYRHFTAIADATGLPMIVYNIPSRTGKNIENDTMLRLAEHEHIVGVKEASGDLPQMMDLLSRRPADLCVLSGDDNLTFPLMAVGGDGVISVAGNLLPADMKELTHLSLEGRWDEARAAHYRLLPLFKALFIETNPIPVKAAMAMRGVLKEVYRLPMCSMSPENRKKLADVVEAFA